MHPVVLRSPLWACLGIALASCAAPRTPDPFSGDLSGRARNGRAVRVTLEVVCDSCAISYSVGAATGSARQARLNPIWIVRLVRNPMSSELVRLAATAEGGSVRRVRIFVDGEIAAVDDNDLAWSRTTLCATTRIPRAASGDPDRGGCSVPNEHAGEGRER